MIATEIPTWFAQSDSLSTLRSGCVAFVSEVEEGVNTVEYLPSIRHCSLHFTYLLI